jgi:hypothetical protein
VRGAGHSTNRGSTLARRDIFRSPLVSTPAVGLTEPSVYRGPLRDVDRGRREFDDPSLSFTEIRISWSCSFLAWGFYKAQMQSVLLPLAVERLHKMLHNARNTQAVFYCRASGKV